MNFAYAIIYIINFSKSFYGDFLNCPKYYKLS